MRPMQGKSPTSTALVRRPSEGTTLGNQEVIEAEAIEDVRASTSNTRRTLIPEPAKDDGRHLKITVVLLRRHIAALDQLAVSIRLRTGVALSRAGIIDAFIEASRREPRVVVEMMLQRRVPLNKYRRGNRRGGARNGKKQT